MPPKKARPTTPQQAAVSGRDEWARLVDCAAAVPTGPLTDDDRERSAAGDGDGGAGADADALSPAVAAFVKASAAAVAAVERPYAPQLSFAEGSHTRPTEAHETDVFTAGRSGGAVDGPDFSVTVREATRGVRQKNSEVMSARRRLHGLDGMVLRASWHRAVDFAPIIVVPAAAAAVIQLGNVRPFLENGVYTPAHETWLDGVGNPTVGGLDKVVHVSPSFALFPGLAAFKTQFRQFRVVDDPRSVPTGEWDRVCACFAGTGEWQFDRWYGGDAERRRPANVFSEVRGFFAYFKDELVPDEVRRWRVWPLIFSRNASREHTCVRTAAQVWEELFLFLDSHHHFRQFTIAAAEL